MSIAQPKRICDLDWCDRPHMAKGLCNMHYQRQLRGAGSLKSPPAEPFVPGDCEFPECGRKRVRGRLCSTHAKQKSQGEALKPIAEKREYTGEVCPVPGCDGEGRLKGFCRAHYHLFRFGLSVPQIEVLYADPRCAICDRMENAGRAFHVDHDHSCCEVGCSECIRGLLCTKCNHGIGLFADSPERLQKAIAYLENGAIL